MFIIHLYPFKAPKNRNFPTLGIPVSYQQKIQLWTQYGDQLGMIVFKKKNPKAHWGQARDCHVHATNGTVQHAPSFSL
jgi:hypothetical protein